MAVIETWFNQDLKEPVKVRYLDGNVFSADNAGNLIGVNLFSDGQPASLSGSVVANVVRSDGATVPVSGTLSGNTATVVLNQSCYAVPGPISIVIKITASGAVTTVCAVVANVYQSSTDSVVDPGTIIPSIEDLIDAIEAAVETIPADYSYINEILKKYVDMNILNPSSISDASQRYGSGITYTVNTSTGIVTANGTAVYDAWIHLYPVGTFDASSGGLYFLSGCPSGGSADKYYVYLETGSSTTLCKDTGNGAFIELASGQSVRVSFLVKAGVTVSSLSFKPQFFKITNGGQTTESIIAMWQNGTQFQYWDNETQKLDKYFLIGSNGEITENTASGYRINTMLCQPGGIYYKKLSGAFTIIVDLVSKTAVTLQNGYGKSQYIHDGSITVSHPVMIFATSNDDKQPLVTDSPVFPSYYVYGKYCGERVITVGTGGDFATLKDGIAYAIQFENAVVNVLAGTYDLISEFGSTYFESMSSSSSEMSGLQIGNGMTILFRPGAKVVCNYTGNNYYAKTRFSPFNFSGGAGFTLIGLDLSCSNVRYAVHDEANNSSTPYRNQYIDCKLHKDNSGNTDWVNPLVIGGGLGVHGHIDIIRTYFNAEQVGSYTTGKSVNYHNASSSSADSILYVEGCYFDGLYTCGLSYYGSSTEITEMQVSGCSLPAEPYINREGSATIENVSIRKFNNEIR